MESRRRVFLFGWPGRFFHPGLIAVTRRAQRRSTAAAGHRAAARSVVDGREHGATLALSGSLSSLAADRGLRKLWFATTQPRRPPDESFWPPGRSLSRRQPGVARRSRPVGRHRGGALSSPRALAHRPPPRPLGRPGRRRRGRVARHAVSLAEVHRAKLTPATAGANQHLAIQPHSHRGGGLASALS